MSQKGADLKLRIAMERAATEEIKRVVVGHVIQWAAWIIHCVCLTGALVCGDAGCLLLIRMRLPTEDNFRSTDS
jgi:hypothetical protein